MKTTSILIIAMVIFIGGAYILTRNDNVAEQIVDANNVSIVDGVQVVEISAKGGYQPRKSLAKAGIPTVIRFNTKGTFDCSSSVRIPSMNISMSLPQSGATDIDIGEGKSGTLQGSCGMGMYPFDIEFQS